MTKNMRIGIIFGIVTVLICAVFAGFTNYNNSQTNALAQNGDTILTLRIGDPKSERRKVRYVRSDLTQGTSLLFI